MSEDHKEETAIVELDLKFSPEVFDPNVQQLEAIAAEVAKIEADPEKMDKDTFELINTTKNKLVKARTRIQAIGKAQRAPAKKYADEVMAYEKKLLGILAPEEERMKDLEGKAKKKAIIDERKKTLPEFREKLANIKDGVEVTDDELLEMDPNQRDAYYNGRLSTKLEADQAKQREEDERIEKQKREMEEKAYNFRLQQILPLGFKDAGANYQYRDDGDVTISKEQLRLLEDGAFNAWLEQMKTFIAECEDKRKKEDAERLARKELENDRLRRLLEIGFKTEGDHLVLSRFEKGPVSVPIATLSTLEADKFDECCVGYQKIVEEEAEAATKRTEETAKAKAKEETDAKALADKKLADEKTEAEAKAKAERESGERFKNWLAQFDYKEETHMLVEKEGKTLLYKYIDEYHHTV